MLTTATHHHHSPSPLTKTLTLAALENPNICGVAICGLLLFSPRIITALSLSLYFQKKGQAQGSCDFAGAATVTPSDPMAVSTLQVLGFENGCEEQSEERRSCSRISYFSSGRRALRSNVFYMDKPVVFTYEEVFHSTNGFSDSNLLGYGTCGSILLYGLLPP